jgi:hypothetical protein
MKYLAGAMALAGTLAAAPNSHHRLCKYQIPMARLAAPEGDVAMSAAFLASGITQRKTHDATGGHHPISLRDQRS